MQLGYYFRDNFKKTGYSQGKLVRGLYQKEVVEGKKTSKAFMQEQTESVMESERKKTDAQVETLSEAIKNSENNIKDIQVKIEQEKENIKAANAGKIGTLTNEKKRIEFCFQTYSIELAENANDTNGMFKKLQEVFGTYAENVKSYISKQADNTKNSLDILLGQTQNFILDDIKRDFLAQKSKDNMEEGEKKNNHNWIYIIALFLLSIYDVFFGQYAVHTAVPRLGMSVAEMVGLGDWFGTFVEFLIAILLVVVGIILLHFLTEESKKEGLSKQISIICIVIVILVFMGYAYTSVEDKVKNEGLNVTNIFFGDNLELIFRILIIPSLFVGDLILNKINTDSLSKSGKGGFVTKLINRGKFFIKKRSFAKTVEEERQHYTEALSEFAQTEIPGADAVLLQVDKIESKIKPICDELINKRNECDAQVQNILSTINNIVQQEKSQLDNIDRLYEDQIANEQNIISKNSAMIRVLNEQLGKAEISVREGIGLGLVD